MTVTNLLVTARSGKNARPFAGTATFSDGKTFHWSLGFDARGEEFVVFETVRNVPVRTFGSVITHRRLASFRSPKRGAAVLAAINA